MTSCRCLQNPAFVLIRAIFQPRDLQSVEGEIDVSWRRRVRRQGGVLRCSYILFLSSNLQQLGDPG